jgi:aspartyl-tRNA(Asn)/glutamyl-tRNA(Gln) amidotransferase subunit A
MSKAIDLKSMAAVDVARAIQDRRISSLEATEEAIKRLKPVHEYTNSVIAFEDEDGRAMARAADAAIAKGTLKGPLAGVPLAHKDMFDRVGKVASWGARIRPDKPATRDSSAMARLNAAGSVQIATLNLSEFAFSPTGHNYVIGHCRNPWNPAHVTGGSSSGSGVVVAAGVVPTALGSDTGGSLRLPAAACGIASIKPTYSRVSRAGAMPLGSLLDTVGALARDVRDLAAMTQVLAGHDPDDGSTSQLPVPDYTAQMQQPVAGTRIGVDEALIAEAHPEIQKRLEAGLKLLEKAGCKRVKVKFPDWRTLDHLIQVVQLVDVAGVHADFMRRRGADYGPQVRARLEFGHFVAAADFHTALRARGTWLAKTLAETYAGADVTILPIIADPLPTIAELDVSDSPKMWAATGRMVKFTRPINYLGLPTIALAMPRAAKELPNGFQLIGRPFTEGKLLALGRAYQQELPPEVATRLA